MGMNELCRMLNEHFTVSVVSQEDYIRRITDPRYHYETTMRTATPLQEDEIGPIKEGLGQLADIIDETMADLGVPGGGPIIWEMYKELKNAVDTKKEVMKSLIGIGEALYSKILNIAWVDALAWQLPTLDPMNKPLYHRMGRTALAMFYIDQLWYRTDSGASNLDRWFGDNLDAKLDALHKMMTEESEREREKDNE